MAYTQTHLDALQEALASGTLTVTLDRILGKPPQPPPTVCSRPRTQRQQLSQGAVAAPSPELEEDAVVVGGLHHGVKVRTA